LVEKVYSEDFIFKELRRHFVYSYLVADRVIQPIGHFFQSSMIRKITHEFEELFHPSELNYGVPKALYAINVKKDGFQEDAEEKVKTFLGEEFSCYHDDEIRNRILKETDGFPVYRRYGKQLDTLALTTLEQCQDGGELFSKIYQIIGDKKEANIVVNPLIQAVEKKEFAILPEYIRYLDTENSTRDYMNLIRIVLMEAYAISCRELYDTSYVNNPLSIYYPTYFDKKYKYELNYLDTNILDIFLKQDDLVRKSIDSINAYQLVELKNSERFKIFLQYYIEFVQGLAEKISQYDYEYLIMKEHLNQKEHYENDLEKVLPDITDNPSLLYYSIEEALNRNNITNTESFVKYSSFPIIGFFSAIYESVIGSYEKYLFQLYQRRKKYYMHKMRANASGRALGHEKNSYQLCKEIMEKFKDWVENKGGWKLINEAASRKKESSIQAQIQLLGQFYKDYFNLDISREANAGRGPVDFKMSKGKDITVVEVKLSSNPQYLHGFVTQIEEYAKAENTDNKIYVLIDMGHPQKIEKIRRTYDEMKKNGEKPSDLIIIDAQQKASASRA
jgi:hypothetical protein